jgi:polygalacturonase
MNPRPSALLFAAAFLAGCATVSPGPVAGGPPDLAPAQPVIPDRTFNLKDFGAKGDNGATVSTEAFKKAIAAVDAAGGGTLVVPAAPGAYFTGPFDLCSNLNLHLEAGAKILFSPRFDDYRITADAAAGSVRRRALPENGGNAAGGRGPRYRPLILAIDLHDVMVSGAGTIDGNGEAWWPEARRFKAEANARHASGNTSPRPVMLSFSGCQRIRFEGVTLTNAPVFNLVQNSCSDITCEKLTILNPAIAPNTDGIDPKDCQRVLIAHCYIDTGDDNVALGGSSGNLEKDILITDCTFLHGHGCSIGSGTASGVENLLVRRCTFDGTDTGVRLKSSRGRGGLVQNIVYEDLTMKNVGQAISISSYYDNTPIDTSLSRSAEAPAATAASRTPQWRNVTIRNVTATACRKSAGLITGLPGTPAEAITLDHVTIEAPTGLKIADTRGITLRAVHVTAATGPDVITDASVTGLVRSD